MPLNDKGGIRVEYESLMNGGDFDEHTHLAGRDHHGYRCLYSYSEQRLVDF